jgi:hypothetical protein
MGVITVCLPATPAEAAVTLVQTKVNFGTGTSITATLSPAAVAGHTLIVVCANNGASTIGGPAGYASIVNESGDMSQAIFYKIAAGGETNISCSFSSNALGGVHIYEYSGLHSYMGYEAFNSSPSYGNGNAISSGTVTTVHANDFLFTAISNDSGLVTDTWNNSFVDQTQSGSGFGQPGGKKADRTYFDAAARTVSSAGSYNATTTFQNSGVANWRGQIVAFRAMSASPSLGVDMVDGSGNGVASPSVTTTSFSKGFSCQTPTGTLGTATQKIRINNTTDNPAWTLAIAASGGPTTRWVSGSNSYDFNDAGGSPAGCSNGQLSINPSVSTITPQTNCTSTGVAKGAASAFSQGTTDSISLVTANNPAYIDCYWDITGINLSQKVPANQPSGNYSINLTLTLTAN